MQREEILTVLREHRADVEKFGVKSFAIFGSAARDQAREDSDVDVLVEFQRPPTFKVYMGLKFFLEDLLGKKVDLVSRNTLKPRVRPYVEREAIYVA
ncbi:MAG: nucleotidyltransferase family protein [Anaerolineales bacterium]|nr:nucleotidyltransferase family protein [Anaerolineales bacterium]